PPCIDQYAALLNHHSFPTRRSSDLSTPCTLATSLRNWRSDRSPLPQPTSSTRSALSPVRLCRSRVWPALPAMSPRLSTALSAPLLAWSTALAAMPSLRPSPMATTRVAVFRVSGRGLLTRNSMVSCPQDKESGLTDNGRHFSRVHPAVGRQVGAASLSARA